MAYGLPTLGCDADEAVALREDQRGGGWKGGPAHGRPCGQRCPRPLLASLEDSDAPEQPPPLAPARAAWVAGSPGRGPVAPRARRGKEGERPRLLPDDPAPPAHRWATVELPWAEGPLLLTLGCAWLSSPLASALPVECAVLHRVVAPPRDRHSIPFLVDLKTA